MVNNGIYIKKEYALVRWLKHIDNHLTSKNYIISKEKEKIIMEGIAPLMFVWSVGFIGLIK